jgi:hypothetical protein
MERVAKIDQQWLITASPRGSWQAASQFNPFLFNEVRVVGVWK